MARFLTKTINNYSSRVKIEKQQLLSSLFIKMNSKFLLLSVFILASSYALANYKPNEGESVFTVATVQGRLWHDYNANGIQEAGEPTIAGSTGNVSGGLLFLQFNYPFTTTNSDPSFSQIILDGFYQVHFDMPFGFNGFSPRDVGGDNNDSDVDPATGTAESFLAVLFHDYDAGVYRNGSLGNRVWLDDNDNGIQDAGELNAPDGTQVFLYRDADGNNLPDGSAIASTTTSGGNYLFTGLVPGNYIVGVRATGYESSSVSAANPNNDDDTDNNGVRSSNGIIYSNFITLTNTREPNGAKHDDNYTLDFGLKISSTATPISCAENIITNGTFDSENGWSTAGGFTISGGTANSAGVSLGNQTGTLTQSGLPVCNNAKNVKISFNVQRGGIDVLALWANVTSTVTIKVNGTTYGTLTHTGQGNTFFGVEHTYNGTASNGATWETGNVAIANQSLTLTIPSITPGAGIIEFSRDAGAPAASWVFDNVVMSYDPPAAPAITKNSIVAPCGGTADLTGAVSNPQNALKYYRQTGAAQAGTDPEVSTPAAVEPGVYYVRAACGSCLSKGSAAITVISNCVKISGNVFNDVNALVAPENTVNGLPITNFVTTPLYVNLYDGASFIGSKQLAGGTYIFDNVAPNKTYHLVLSTTQNTNIPSVPAGDWYNTGENIGTTPGSDGTPDGIISVPLATTDVVNVNFGLQQPPTVISTILPSRANPGGTTSVPVPNSAFKGTDVNGGVPVKITITGFPANATSFTVYPVAEGLGGITYYPNSAAIPAACPTVTCEVFPPAGVDVFVDVNGNPYSVRLNPDGSETKVPAVYVDPVDGAVSSVFTYITIDNGDAKSPSGTVTVPFTTSLPVKLVKFSVSNIENLSVQLSWTTAWEQNNKGFEIERSADAKRWTSIGNVDSRSDEKGSNEQLSYNFIDAGPVVGANYYRLKQVDWNGNFEYSQIQMINWSGKIAVYPNPTIDGRIRIKGLQGGEVIRIFSNDGRQIKVFPYEGGDINVVNLPSGIYIMRIVGKDGGVTHLNFIKGQ